MLEIKEKFDAVIKYSQDIPEPKTDKLFEIWQKAKAKFIDAFGGYIYEYPEKVSFELSEKAKTDMINNFIDQVCNYWDYGELSDFLVKQAPGFYDNITITDYTTRNGKVIKKGTKLVRSFKHFIQNERSLEDIQNKASRIIQENKIEGTLCLSVHPLDFLSLSENTHNWRSCHALDGEYRAGNLSYMMDSTTFICYLKSEEDTFLPSFPVEVKWNSKKWRCLLFMSNDNKMMFAGRPYPFESASGMDLILKEVLPACGLIKNEDASQASLWDDTFKWSDWNRGSCLIKEIETPNGPLSLEDEYIIIGQHLKPLSSVVSDVIGSKHFNDVLNSSCYKPIYCYQMSNLSAYTLFYNGRVYPTTDDRTHFDMGAYTYCLRCGEREVLGGSDTMMCEECELKHGTLENDLFTHCSCCGRRVYAEDTTWVEEEQVCESCVDNHCTQCEDCGEWMFNEHIRYNEDTDEYLCEYCYNK